MVCEPVKEVGVEQVVKHRKIVKSSCFVAKKKNNITYCERYDKNGMCVMQKPCLVFNDRLPTYEIMQTKGKKQMQII